ncbi:hypothetical protein KIN20_035650 [Parelaphostrongylus tenuis]|uniref:Uncharacterized protein n=1 Tax=Parelaphostrongylus tenuis TaxID=148309 RepID=A0AAD5REV4_PARTN|nr:hypothetical protein KIN20_035650 [Parelaphostrongylus tenuis]
MEAAIFVTSRDSSKVHDFVAHGAEVEVEFFLGAPRRRPITTYSDQMYITVLDTSDISNIGTEKWVITKWRSLLKASGDDNQMAEHCNKSRGICHLWLFVLDERFRRAYTRHSLIVYHQPLFGIILLLLDKLLTKSSFRRRTGNNLLKTRVVFEDELKAIADIEQSKAKSSMILFRHESETKTILEFRVKPKIED